MDLCQYVKQLWELYMSCDNEEAASQLLDVMDETITIIGTGKHEFYESREEFVKAFGMETPERAEIEFHIQSIWAREVKLGDDASMVYGELHVTGRGRQAKIGVDMDTRYSMILCRKEGKWKVTHIHQSLPYREQQEGEYYPKTLLDQVEEANKRAEQMEKLARIDQMTGLLNHHFFYKESQRLLEQKKTGYCMTIDLDDFKQINDSYGHQEGDAVLQEVGRMIRQAAGPGSVAGRTGGDEFALFCTDLASDADACAVGEEILRQTDRRIRERKGVFPGVSIGISRIREGESLKEAFRRADIMLYQVKRQGKHGYRFYE